MCPHKHQLQGRIFTIKIAIEVPGSKLVIDREHSQNHAHEDAFVAVRDAFDAMTRKLRAYNAKNQPRGVKRHGPDAREVFTAEVASLG